ncbi:sterol carrier family protein [Corynebacterium mayonis]|uniref:sterol carrier family protein n=1 Tax=Corynebacterium mayonis TaxID=3062461 RepID=UPI00314031CB
MAIFYVDGSYDVVMTFKNDPATTRAALNAVVPWLRGEAEMPARAVLAQACRQSARALAAKLPGHAVEVRVPPFVAVQCIEGPRHTRGTPPNVVQCDARTWLLLAVGELELAEAMRAGTVEVSGSRAGEVGKGLPVIAI